MMRAGIERSREEVEGEREEVRRRMGRKEYKEKDREDGGREAVRRRKRRRERGSEEVDGEE